MKTQLNCSLIKTQLICIKPLENVNKFHAKSNELDIDPVINVTVITVTN